MANPELNIDVNLNDADYQRGAREIQTSVKKISDDFKSLGREIGQVSRTLTIFSGSITAGIGAAFSKASKDIPAVNQQLKDISNSFQVLSNNLATAAMPSLKAFADLLNGSVAVISKFVSEHGELVNQFIKYSAITLAVGTLGMAFSSLFKFISSVIGLLRTLGVVTTLATAPIITMTSAIIAAAAALGYLAANFPKFRASGFVGLGASLGGANSGIGSFISGLKSQIASLKATFQSGINEPLQRSTDLLGKFSEGFKNTISSLGEAVSNFGAGVAQSLDKALGDTIFNAITGRFNSLKDVVNSLGNDLARAFSKFASNEIMAMLFGDKEGGSRRGLFGGIGGLFGRGGGRGVQSDHDKAIRKNSKTFEELTDNMKKFAKAKDDVIDRLKEFGRNLANTNTPGGGGASAGVLGIGAAAGEDLATAIEPLNAMNEVLGVTMGMVTGIGAGFTSVTQKIIKMGQVYAITQAVMLGVSAAASAVMVAIGTATAQALAAVWAVPAVLASIATLGAAAVIGSGAVGSAVAAAPGMGSAGVSGALPSGAGISFGDGASGIEGIPKMADGGIVNRPTLALIGEAGPEAVVPLKNGKQGMGGNNVSINIDTAMLNSPSNMRDFVKMLKEELAR